MSSMPSHYRPADEDDHDPPPPYTLQANDPALATRGASSYPVMNSVNSSHYPVYHGHSGAPSITTTTTAQSPYPALVSPRPPTSYPSSSAMSPVVPAAPMVPYPAMAPIGSGIPPFSPTHATHPVPGPLSAMPYPAGLVPGPASWPHAGSPLMQPPPPHHPIPAAAAAAATAPVQPLPPPHHHHHHHHPSAAAYHPHPTPMMQQPTNTLVGPEGMSLIPSPALAPPLTTTAVSTNGISATPPLLSNTPAEMPMLVTVYQCRKCGASLASADAVCTRLHAGAGAVGWGAEKIQKATAAMATYGEKSARRVDKKFDFSKDVAVTQGSGSGSSSSGGGSGGRTSSLSESSTSPITIATTTTTTTTITTPTLTTSPSLNYSSTWNGYPNEKSGWVANNSHPHPPPVYEAPPPSSPPTATHDPAAIYDLRNMSLSSPSSSSPSQLGRSRSVQNPMVSAKKFWRDFRKEAQQQGNYQQQQQQDRIVVSPEGTTFVPGAGQVRATMRRQSYPVPPGTVSQPGTVPGTSGGVNGLQRHATVHHLHTGDHHQHQQGAPPAASPSGSTPSFPAPPPFGRP